MKVFISWSGDFSHECAKIVLELIDTVIQGVQPWLSSTDIDKGAIWFNSINEQLSETKVGIVCLTPDNKDNRWILFEAGALSKGLNVSRVCTFLINLNPADIKDPLAQFNHTIFDQESVRALLKTINKELENPVKEASIDKVFDLYWPEIEQKLNDVVKNHSQGTNPAEAPPSRSDQILDEILLSTRSLGKRVGSIQRVISEEIVGQPFVETDPRFEGRNARIDKNVHLATIAVMELERSIQAMVDKGATREEVFDAYVDRMPINLIEDLVMPMIKRRENGLT